MLQVILQDDLCRAAKRRTDGCQLDEDFRAVPAVLNHALDRLQMADRTGQAVEHCLCLGVRMRVRMAFDMLAVEMVGVYDTVAVVMIIYFVAHGEDPLCCKITNLSFIF